MADASSVLAGKMAMPTGVALWLKRLLPSNEEPAAEKKTPQAETGPQQSGLVAASTSAANRLRETAKWLIAAFAAVRPVAVRLTDTGKRELSPLLGDRCASMPEFRALAIDGKDPQLEVVTSPQLQLGCQPARFMLTSARGNASPVG
jgi:hypothetical protein